MSLQASYLPEFAQSHDILICINFIIYAAVYMEHTRRAFIIFRVAEVQSLIVNSKTLMPRTRFILAYVINLSLQLLCN